MMSPRSFATVALSSALLASPSLFAQTAPADAQPTTTAVASTPTEATRPIEQTPSPAARARASRLHSVRSACRDTRRADVFGIVTVPIFAASGIALSAVAFTTPSAERTNGTAFMGSLGPGLVLAAIGVPFGRGWIGAVDPLRNGCDSVSANDDPQEADLVGTEGLLRAFGGPASPVLPIIVGVATAAVGGATAAAFALNNRDLVQAMGGIAAFVIAGWALVPPTPNLSAARRYTSGGYALSNVSVAFTGNGLSLGGAF
ncbi:MAG: hypothetical protein U0269_23760 [Polyangiales bacterium]